MSYKGLSINGSPFLLKFERLFCAKTARFAYLLRSDYLRELLLILSGCTLLPNTISFFALEKLLPLRCILFVLLPSIFKKTSTFSRHYFERYQQGGLPALLDDSYSGAEPKLDAHQMSELEGYLEEYILPDAKSVIAHIDKQYGVHYSVSGVTDLLHRLGFSYKKPTHVPGKQDPAQQQAFLEE
jgi:transposase